jgi:hypothetical protein
MASSEWARELTLLEEPKMQAWVERAANRMVGELLLRCASPSCGRRATCCRHRLRFARSPTASCSCRVRCRRRQWPGGDVFEWRAGAGDETPFQHSSTMRRWFIARSPVAPGAMRCSAPRVEAVRPRITYRRTLDFVGDDRGGAGRVVSPAALFFNHTPLANFSRPKGGFVC